MDSVSDCWSDEGNKNGNSGARKRKRKCVGKNRERRTKRLGSFLVIIFCHVSILDEINSPTKI